MSKKTTEAKRPTHAIYVVQGEGENTRWVRIGAAWQHKDKKGSQLVFDALPVSGRVVMRAVEDDGAENTGKSAQEGQ